MLRTFLQKYLLLNIVTKRHAGHSKWQNIRHIKGAKDAERNVLFTKLSRQIKVAVQEGGSLNPSNNIKLFHVLEQCKRFSMPVATMQSVLKACQSDKSNAKSYMIEIKSKFSDGGAVHLFQEKGIVEAENPALSSKPKEEQLELATEHAIEINTEEVTIVEDNIFQFVCSKTSFQETQNLLEKLGYKIVNASVDYVPIKMMDIGPTDLELFEKLMKKLEEMPDVVRLFDNANAS